MDDEIRSSFSEGDAAKILSIARYWNGSGGNTLPRLESWQVMHLLSYSEAITEDVYGDLFNKGAWRIIEGQLQRQGHCRGEEVLRLFPACQQSGHGYVHGV